MFNFRLIMLLDKQYEPDEDKRIDKAFRHMGENPADEERFDSYVRGGVDVLYEKLIEEQLTRKTILIICLNLWKNFRIGLIQKYQMMISCNYVLRNN